MHEVYKHTHVLTDTKESYDSTSQLQCTANNITITISCQFSAKISAKKWHKNLRQRTKNIYCTTAVRNHNTNTAGMQVSWNELATKN